MTGRWWRHNWWALVAVVPVLAGIVLLSPSYTYQAWRDSRAEVPVSPGEDGWASLSGVRLRLAALDHADLRGPDGDPFPLPAGLRAWLATVSIEPPADTNLTGEPPADQANGPDGDDPLNTDPPDTDPPDTDPLDTDPLDDLFGEVAGDVGLGSCRVVLEDDAGRLFGDNPQEATGAQIGPGGPRHLPATCLDPAGDEGSGPFDVQALFVLPTSAQPVAVRVTPSSQPAYAWLPVT